MARELVAQKGLPVFSDDREKVVNLERMNAELRTSLKRCRDLLVECRSRLAANDDLPLFRWGKVRTIRTGRPLRTGSPPQEPKRESESGPAGDVPVRRLRASAIEQSASKHRDVSLSGDIPPKFFRAR